MPKKLAAAIWLLLLFFIHAAASVSACCSLAPARFSNTYGWTGELTKDGKLIHILAYENMAQNLNMGNGSLDGQAVGNAMILPIPAVPGSLGPKNMLPGASFRNVLKQMYESTRGPLEKLMDKLLEQLNATNNYDVAASQAEGALSVQVFDSGSYTVVLSTSAAAIPGALSRVPADKRPAINRAIFDAYDKWYPGWSFALCCFHSGVDSPEPLVWWYEPKNPNELFFPAVDSHTGAVPPLNTLVDVDHKLVVSSDRMFGGFAGTWLTSAQPVEITQALDPLAKAYIPKYAMSSPFTGKMLQGDFCFNVNDVRMGIWRPIRSAPEGSPHDLRAELADFFFENKYLLAKVAAAYTFAIVGLALMWRWKPCAAMLSGGGVLYGIGALMRSYTVDDLSSLESIAFQTALISLAALMAPLLMAGNKRPSVRSSAWLGAGLFALAAWALPNYSSSWLPLVWAILLCWIIAHPVPRSAAAQRP